MSESMPEEAPAEKLGASTNQNPPESPEKKRGPVSQSQSKKRNRTIILTLLLFLVIGILSFLIWWVFYSQFQRTDDAYVGADKVVISSRQDGSVVAYYVDDTEYVEEGQLLVQLDKADYLLMFEEKKEVLALEARHVRTLYEDVQQKQANVLLQTAKYEKAKSDLMNREPLANNFSIAIEDWQHAEADYKIAEAALKLADLELAAAITVLGPPPYDKHPLIEKAKVEAINAYLALSRCNILSPVSGYVAKRNVQLGQTVNRTTALLEIIPLSHIWVDANFKENQLTHMRIGQPVKMMADIYGREVAYTATIAGILAGTGSTFSLIPAQNASGNWIKIVQRVPVRIYLNPEQIKKFPLVMGFSMNVTVDTSDRTGPFLAEAIERSPVITKVFDVPLEELIESLDEIIQNNLLGK